MFNRARILYQTAKVNNRPVCVCGSCPVSSGATETKVINQNFRAFFFFFFTAPSDPSSPWKCTCASISRSPLRRAVGLHAARRKQTRGGFESGAGGRAGDETPQIYNTKIVLPSSCIRCKSQIVVNTVHWPYTQQLSSGGGFGFVCWRPSNNDCPCLVSSLGARWSSKKMSLGLGGQVFCRCFHMKNTLTRSLIHHHHHQVQVRVS